MILQDQEPLYIQVKQHILEQIKGGKFKPGDKLPSEKELTDLFGVSRVTVRNALGELQSEGIIVRISGKGTFVADAKDTDKANEDEKGTLNSKEVGVIGVILCHIDSPFHIRLLTSIEKEVNKQGYRMLFALSNGEFEKEQSLIDSMLLAGVQGLVIYPADGKFYNEEILKLSIENFPIVLVDRYLPGINTCSVYSDNKEGAYLVGDYLASKGHENIALLSPSPGETMPLLDRLEGFSKALNANNIQVKSHLWVTDLLNCPVPDKKGRHMENINKIEALINAHKHKNDKITAMYAINALTALVTYKAVINLGYRVPDDIEIVCFDNTTEYFTIEDYPISFIDHSEEAMGRAAVQSVVDIINGKSPKNTIVPCNLVKK